MGTDRSYAQFKKSYKDLPVEYKIRWLEFKYTYIDIHQTDEVLYERFKRGELPSFWAETVGNTLRNDIMSGRKTIEDLEEALKRMIVFSDSTLNNRAIHPTYTRFTYYELNKFIQDYMAGSNKLIDAIISHKALPNSLEYKADIQGYDWHNMSNKERAFTNFVMEQVALKLLGGKQDFRVYKIMENEIGVLRDIAGFNDRDLMQTRYYSGIQRYNFTKSTTYIQQVIANLGLEVYYKYLGGALPSNRERLWYEDTPRYALTKFEKYYFNISGYRKMMLFEAGKEEILKRATINIIVKSLRAA